MADQTFVVVGAGLAGAKAVEALRDKGFAGRLVLVGAEPHLPYERPPLSKGYLKGEATREDATCTTGPGTTSTRRAASRRGRRPRVDPPAHTVTLADGERAGLRQAAAGDRSQPPTPRPARAPTSTAC